MTDKEWFRGSAKQFKIGVNSFVFNWILYLHMASGQGEGIATLIQNCRRLCFCGSFVWLVVTNTIVKVRKSCLAKRVTFYMDNVSFQSIKLQVICVDFLFFLLNLFYVGIRLSVSTTGECWPPKNVDTSKNVEPSKMLTPKKCWPPIKARGEV